MGRRKVAAGASLAGEEQAIVDRFGECLTTVRTARQREGVRPAGKRVGSPAMDLDRADPTRERSSEQICQLGNGKVEEGPLAARFERGRQPAAEINLDLRPAEGSEVIGSGAGAVDAAEQPRVRFEFLGILEREEQLVGKPER